MIIMGERKLAGAWHQFFEAFYRECFSDAKQIHDVLYEDTFNRYQIMIEARDLAKKAGNKDEYEERRKAVKILRVGLVEMMKDNLCLIEKIEEAG